MLCPILKDLFACGMRHLRQCGRSGMQLRPKHHVFTHLLLNVKKFGNPSSYACFRDESDNKKLAAICSVAHASVWEQRVFSNFGLLVEASMKVASSKTG